MTTMVLRPSRNAIALCLFSLCTVIAGAPPPQQGADDGAADTVGADDDCSLLADSNLLRRGAKATGAFNKIGLDRPADDGDNSSYCLGKISDVPAGIIALYNKCTNDYPTVPAVEFFDMAAFVGRFFVAATSEASKSVAYQCRCPAIDVGYAGPNGFPHRWNWQVTMRPDDSDKNRHVINPLLQYYEWSDKRKPQLFKDPLDGNSPAEDYVPDPLYTCVVVKTGLVMARLGGYLYYVLSCEKLPGDTGLPFLPRNGTFTFEAYTRDLKVFFEEGYYEEVEQFIASQTKGNPCTSTALKLVKQNHTGCTYPYEPAYTVTTKEAAAEYQKMHGVLMETSATDKKIGPDSPADDGDNNSYCLGKISDVPAGIIALYNKCTDDYPTVPAVKFFDMAAFVGRFFVAATSEASKSVAYQCRCPAIDVGYAGPNGFPQRWNWQVTMRPDDSNKNRHGINPLLQYYEWSDKRKPQLFKDPLDGNSPAEDYVPDPLYTCVVVKTGPVMARLGGYLYYVLSCEKLPGDTGLPFLPNNGTFTFEAYTRDLKVFFEEGYYEEVEEFIASQTKGNPCTSTALKLVKQNHTGCTYPYEPAYTVTTKEAAAEYQKRHGVLMEIAAKEA